MIHIQNNEKYITPSTLDQCFQKGKHLKVDKVVTGNGFSTAFLKKNPPPTRINIMIAPNKAVVIDKEKAYMNGKINTTNKIGFFYKEGKGVISDFYNIMMFVADSFYLYSNQIYQFRDKINWILVDESHSVEIQSSFRWVLRDFDSKVEKYLNEYVAITSVTATPNFYTNIDVKIHNKYVHHTVINMTNDRLKTIERIKNDLTNNENVVVCTNSMAVIYRLRNRERVVKGNFIIGTSLYRSCVTSFKLVQDPESNLTILSARGFEGYDILDENCKVYFFEDRAKEHETFYLSNLYQAINRTRKGAKYIEYSVRRFSDCRKVPVSDEDVEKFINDENLTVESKQKKEYAAYHPFVIFNQDNEGVFTIKKDIVALNLRREMLIYDDGFEGFETFLNERNIIINDLKEKQTSIPNLRIPLDIKKENLLSNRDIINRLDLFGDDFSLNIQPFEKWDTYKDYVMLYLIRKVFDVGDEKVNEFGLRDINEREAIGLNYFTNKKDFDNLVNRVVKAYNKRSIEKYGKADSKSYRDEFKDKSEKIVAQFIMAYMNKFIQFPANWVANRNYNLPTLIGMDEIKLISDEFNLNVREIDLKSAFPRILYAKNDMELPGDFYGENKKNKLRINIMLNDFFYNEKKKSTYKDQKRNAITRLENLGIHEKVINFLIENFYDKKDRGALFHWLSYYEKRTISEVKNLFDEVDNIGLVRRHDSLLIFGSDEDLSFLNDFEFLGVKGWFNFEYKKELIFNLQEHVETWE
jgi:hypothetical protein